MKTLIITVLLTIGMVGFTTGQTAPKNKFERLFHKEKKVEVRKQTKHFEDLKVDKEKVKHNGTTAFHQIRPKKHVVDGNGFSTPKAYSVAGKNKSMKSTGNKTPTLHKRKNKTFETYVMK